MFEVKEPLNETNELQDIIAQIKARTLPCANQVNVKGDTRFWGIKPEQFELFKEFYAVAQNSYESVVGKSPKHIRLMINHVEAGVTENGSGDGWHVDSVQRQYKCFMYLTDCESQRQGPLCILKAGSNLRERAAIIFNYLVGNKFRFPDEKVEKMTKSGFKLKPVLLKKLIPFFADTSLIHRGLRIEEGERIMVTAYMFDGDIPESIRKRLKDDS